MEQRALLLVISLLLAIKCHAQIQPIAWWPCDNVSGTNVVDIQAQISDTISGNYRTVGFSEQRINNLP